MFCSNCGANNEGNPKFCANCGAPMMAAAPPVGVPQPQAPAPQPYYPPPPQMPYQYAPPPPTKPVTWGLMGWYSLASMVSAIVAYVALIIILFVFSAIVTGVVQGSINPYSSISQAQTMIYGILCLTLIVIAGALLLFGWILGKGQSLVIKDYVSKSNEWAKKTMWGYFLGTIVAIVLGIIFALIASEGISVEDYLSNPTGMVSSIFGAAGWIGLITQLVIFLGIGLAQAQALSPQLRNSNYWILANLAGAFAIFLVNLIFGSMGGIMDISNFGAAIGRMILSVLLGWAAYGAVAGAFLVWMLQSAAQNTQSAYRR